NIHGWRPGAVCARTMDMLESEQMTALEERTASKCSWIARRRNIRDRASAHTDCLIEDQERLDQTATTDLLLLLVLVTDLIDHVGGVLECFVEVVQLFVGVGVVIKLELFHSRRSVVDVGGEFVEFRVRHERLLGSGRVNVPMGCRS